VVRRVINQIACADIYSTWRRTESTDTKYRIGVAPSTAAGFPECHTGWTWAIASARRRQSINMADITGLGV
jgi:hypothetical protein